MASFVERRFYDMQKLSLLIRANICRSSAPSYRGQLGEGTEGPRGRGQGG